MNQGSFPCTAILTQSSGHHNDWVVRLKNKGWQVHEWPALQIEPMLDFHNEVPLPEAFDLVIFVSANAARLYLQQLTGLGRTQWPLSCTAATVGPRTAAVLYESGWFGSDAKIVYPGAEVPYYDSEALWQRLVPHLSKFRRVLMVRATEGRNWLMTRLHEQGAMVCLHEVYRRLPTIWNTTVSEQLLTWATQHLRPVWLITSLASIEAIQANIVALGILTWWTTGHFVLIHPRLVAPLGVLGVEDANITVCTATADAIFNALVFGFKSSF